MEPDKTYSLHPDDTSQANASSTQSFNEQKAPPEAPSAYDQPKGSPSSQSADVPWYLRPLTQTAQSSSTQQQRTPVEESGLPIVEVNQQSDEPQTQPGTVTQSQQPNASTAPILQAPPMSPFRSKPIVPLAPPTSWNRQSSESQTSADRFQVPNQSKKSEYHNALAASVPKPFSQFGAQQVTQPVEKNPPNSRNFRKFSGIALAVLLVSGIGFGVYSMWGNNTPSTTTPPAVVANTEKKLYLAIENHLSTAKIRQVYTQTITSVDTSVTMFDVTSDFSDPRNPKSHINYERRPADSSGAIQESGELTIMDADEYYGKLTKASTFYEGADNMKPKENQWYSVAADDTIGEALMDPIGVRLSLNSPLGEFPVGNFSEQTRQELMQYIKGQNVYAVKSSERVEVDGRKMTRYTINFNAEAVNELNKRIFVATGGDPDEVPIAFTKNETQKTELWVSDDTTKIAKVKISRKSMSGTNESGVKEDIEVNLTYPNSISIISKPVDATAGPWRKS